MRTLKRIAAAALLVVGLASGELLVVGSMTQNANATKPTKYCVYAIGTGGVNVCVETTQPSQCLPS